DEAFKPWLLEVNLSPALSVDSDIDVEVKKPLLEDVLDLVGLKPIHAKTAQEHADYLEQQQKQETRSRRKGSQSLQVLDEDVLFPEPRDRVGNFRKVYPFNAATTGACTKKNVKKFDPGGSKALRIFMKDEKRY
ncbi:hypothetical protein BC829DRAFT_212123, partial [Chytridium lagenaria]